MEKSRGAAILLNEAKYDTGKPCRKGHIAPRYTSNGGCVECVSLTALAHQRAIDTAPTPVVADRLRREQCNKEAREAGGPWSRQEAEEVGLGWFVCGKGSCIGVVSLNSAKCLTCGRPEYSEEALDLLG